MLDNKSNQELDKYIDNKNLLSNQILNYLRFEITKRKYRVDEIINIQKEISDRLNLKKEVENIKINPKYSFRKPSFKSSFKINTPQKTKINHLVQSLHILNWDIVFQKNNVIEAKRRGINNYWKEKIIIKIEEDFIKVLSKSIDNIFCDFGNNYKRFIELKTTLELLEEKWINSKTNLENYLNYENLEIYSQPRKIRKEKKSLLIVGSLILALFVGFVYKLVINLTDYVFTVSTFDLGDLLIVNLVTVFGVGYFLGLGFDYLIRLSHIADDYILKRLGFVSILLAYLTVFFLLNLQYKEENQSILEYINLYLKQEKYIFFGIHLSKITLIIICSLNFLLILLIFYLKVAEQAIKFDINNAPEDVIDFVISKISEGKTEEEICLELKKIGWKSRKHQNIVFNAIYAKSYWW